MRVRYLHVETATEEMRQDTIVHRGEINGGLLGQNGAISKVYVGASGMVYEFVTRLSWPAPKAYKLRLKDAREYERFSDIA